MARPKINPTGREVGFHENELIVSKTDVSGKITYANNVFLKVAGYSEQEALNQPHNFIRHPDMPRCVFKLLWDTLEQGREIFAYVINMTKKGDFYWVYAHVTPTFDSNNQIIGYHSNRRVPDREKLPAIQELYAKLLAEENRHALPKDGLAASQQMLTGILSGQGIDYDQFIHSF